MVLKNLTIPSGLQAILWSKSLDVLDIDRDKNYIINQVLAYGFLDHLKWLFRVYPKEIIQKTFLENTARIYSARSMNFINLLLFGQTEMDLDERRYVIDQ